MDGVTTPAEYWQQAAYSRKRADEVADEQLRALWMAMAQIWTKLAEQADQASQATTRIADDALR
jgi:hypothetical protein